MLAAKTMTKKVAALTAWSAVAEALAGWDSIHIFFTRQGKGFSLALLFRLMFIDVAGLCSKFNLLQWMILVYCILQSF